MTLAKYGVLIAAWDSATTEVKRAWIFGSYAYGSPRSDSDLDVTVEIHPAAIDHWGMFTFRARHGDRLEMDLRHCFSQEFPSLEVNLELFHRYHGTPAYRAICDRRLVPVYKRP